MIERRLAGVAAFPQDLRAEHGYDNRGDHLSLSPLLMESFLKLGQSITQSPDFAPKNVGHLEDVFRSPADDVNQDQPKSTPSGAVSDARRFVARSTTELLDRYVSFVARQLDAGVAFPDAMKSVAAATISSPEVSLSLRQIGGERGPRSHRRFRTRFAAVVFSVGQHSRSDAARSRRGWESDEARRFSNAQIDRMLKDRKLKRFCDSFPSQWLQLERIISSAPNPREVSRILLSQIPRQHAHDDGAAADVRNGADRESADHPADRFRFHLSLGTAGRGLRGTGTTTERKASAAARSPC